MYSMSVGSSVVQMQNKGKKFKTGKEQERQEVGKEKSIKTREKQKRRVDKRNLWTEEI